MRLHRIPPLVQNLHSHFSTTILAYVRYSTELGHDAPAQISDLPRHIYRDLESWLPQRKFKTSGCKLYHCRAEPIRTMVHLWVLGRTQPFATASTRPGRSTKSRTRSRKRDPSLSLATLVLAPSKAVLPNTGGRHHPQQRKP